jgi:hypothetical protein
VTDSLARELVEVMVPRAQLRRMMEGLVTMTQQMTSAQISSALEELDLQKEGQQAEIAELKEEIYGQVLEDTRRFYFEEVDIVSRSRAIYERLYAKHFSEQELRDLLLFYRTPTGQKLVATQPDLAMEGMQALNAEIAPLTQDFMARTLRRINKAVEEQLQSRKSKEPPVSYHLEVAPTVGSPGDTVQITVGVRLMVGVDTAPVRVRGYCAENVDILRGGEVVATLPPSASCPDSTLTLDSGVASSRGGYVYFYSWVIPDDLMSGRYTVRGTMLVAPQLEVEETLQIQ